MNPFGTALTPSRIILGTASYGSSISKDEAFAVMDAYFELGGNVLDTANIYSSWEPNGEGTSELTVGEWIRSRGVRNQIILGTKGGHPDMANMGHGRCSIEDLQQHLSESLERLGLDYINIYWLHRDDPGLSPEAIIDNLAILHGQGSIGCFGASNWVPERISAANNYAKAQHLHGFVISQPGWALAEHGTKWDEPSPMLYLDETMHTWHVQTGFPLAPYASQARGYFGRENAEWAARGFPDAPPRAADYDSPINRERLLRAMALAHAKGCTANQVALAYALYQPFPTYPIISTRSVEHVREAMGALSVELTPGECAGLRSG